MTRATRAADVFSRLSGAGGAAAEMAFYFALSLVPFLGLTAIAAVSWLPPDLGGPLANTLIRGIAPEAGLDAAAIAAWVRSLHGSGLLAAGVLLAVYSSLRFMGACVRALSSTGRSSAGDLGHRLRSTASAAFLVVLWMVTLLALSFVVLVAPPLEEALETSVLSRGAVTAATLSRAMATIVVLAAIAVTYRAVPGLGARGGRLWATATIATAGWVAAGWGVTRLLPALWRAEALYGTLASFVVFLLWSYANAWVLLVCGRFAARTR